MAKTTSDIPHQQLESFSEDHISGGQIVVLDGPVAQHFSVFSRSEAPCKANVSDSRRDYYKITLISNGDGIFIYDGKRYEISEPTLVFMNPTSVLSWEATSPKHDGFYCVFRESFFSNNQRLLHDLKDYPLFRVGNNPLLTLTEDQIEAIENIFQNMMTEYVASQPMKSQMLMLYLQQLLLEGRRMYQKKTPEDRELDAGHRHTQEFMELLEQQFPIGSIEQRVTLTSPSQFAEALSLHANHLNTQVKEVTGENIRSHIQKRLLIEAKILLSHTEWPIADIAFCLGFDEPASFSHFIKRHTDRTPSSIRS